MPPRAAAAPATAFGSFGFSTSAFAPASSTPRSPRASHLICHAAVASSPCGGDPVLPRNFSLAPNVLPRITGPPPPPPLGPPRHLTHRFDETFDRLQPRSVSLSSPLLSLATRSSLYDIRVSIYMYMYIYKAFNDTAPTIRWTIRVTVRRKKKRVFPPRFSYRPICPRR